MASCKAVGQQTVNSFCCDTSEHERQLNSKYSNGNADCTWKHVTASHPALFRCSSCHAMEQPVAEDGWQLVAGDDDVPERNPRLRERHLVWQQMVAARSTRSFQDAEFPAGPRAVDGRREDRVGTDVFRATLSEVSHRAGVSEEGVLCRCGQPAQLRRVQRKGPTFGRPYYACPLRSCRFFEFADQASTVAALELQWKRFPAFGDWCVVRDEGFRPADVQQGGVGDCWFMSALAASWTGTRAIFGAPV